MSITSISRRLRIQILCLSLSIAFGCHKKNPDIPLIIINSSPNGSVPVYIDMDDHLENDFVLMQSSNGNATEIPFQIDTLRKKIWFMARGADSISYFIKRGKHQESMDRLTATKKEGNLNLNIGKNLVVSYRYEMTYPPKGVDSIFKKSGFIHPLLAPNGDTLTRIQPPDHNHHYGIWGPWTHTQIDGQQVDFWNLGDGKGTVLFKDFNSISTGDVFTSFSASQEHIDFITKKEPQLALNENLEVTLWKPNRQDRYILDYSTSFSTPLLSGILFEAYRYGGGLGMRFTERWHKDNCSVLTSEGNDRLTADGTNARWCIVNGESSDGNSTNGILFMSHPSNRMHPEPMRVWPIDANGGRGDMFFEFCPIRHEEWKIEPNKTYELKYRMVVFEGSLSPEEAEVYWQAFAKPPAASIVSN